MRHADPGKAPGLAFGNSPGVTQRPTGPVRASNRRNPLHSRVSPWSYSLGSDDLPRRAILIDAELESCRSIAVRHDRHRRARRQILTDHQPALRCGSTPLPSKAISAATCKSPDRRCEDEVHRIRGAQIFGPLVRYLSPIGQGSAVPDARPPNVRAFRKRRVRRLLAPGRATRDRQYNAGQISPSHPPSPRTASFDSATMSPTPVAGSLATGGHNTPPS